MQANLEFRAYQLDVLYQALVSIKIIVKERNGILLPKLFWPAVRKKCSSDLETLLTFEAEGWEFVKMLGSLEQFIQTVKGQNNYRMLF